jgi:hypothetical protein
MARDTSDVARPRHVVIELLLRHDLPGRSVPSHQTVASPRPDLPASQTGASPRRRQSSNHGEAAFFCPLRQRHLTASPHHLERKVKADLSAAGAERRLCPSHGSRAHGPGGAVL